MQPDIKTLEEKGCELFEIDEKTSAWVLPQIQNFRKLVALSRGGTWAWVHPEFKNGKNDKKKK
tara:strand:+ start:838 stop:1026 length:189 start_codon:yes stop_codon:yes gene_type:complete